MTPQQHEQHVKAIRAFVEALNLFNSPDPKRWDDAFGRLAELGELELTPDQTPNPQTEEHMGDHRLITQAKGTDARKAEAARKELGLRAKIIILCAHFDLSYDPSKWESAKKELFAIPGDRAQWMLSYALLSGLVVHRPRDWQHIRYYLAELGAKGYQVVRAYLETVLLPRVPDGAIGATAGFTFHKDKLEQCLMALLQFGPIARDYFIGLTKSPKPWIRRSITVAIAGTRDASRFDTLLAYATGDPDEDVRAQTFDSLGKMVYAADEAGPILLKALSTEKSETCLTHITKALVELNYRSGVPQLIEVLDHPDYPVVRAAMDALVQLTGIRRMVLEEAKEAPEKRKIREIPQTPAEWKDLWNKVLKPAWK